MPLRDTGSIHRDRPSAGPKTNLNSSKRLKSYRIYSLNRGGIQLNVNDKIIIKSPNTQKLNNILLNKPRVKEEMTQEITEYFYSNDSEDITYQNVWDAAEAVLRGQVTFKYYLYYKKV